MNLPQKNKITVCSAWTCELYKTQTSSKTTLAKRLGIRFEEFLPQDINVNREKTCVNSAVETY